MIRVGGTTTGTSNVLEGTLFQQIGRPMNITVRAKQLIAVPDDVTTAGKPNQAAFNSAKTAELEIGAVSLSSVVLNQQANLVAAGAVAASNSGYPIEPVDGGVQLSDCDIIFMGTVRTGSLSLKFAGAATNNPVLYDVTAN